MKTPAPVAGVLCLLSGLAWAGATRVGDPPQGWAPVQLAILTTGLLILAAAALVGMVVRDSRWGRRLAGCLAVGQLGLAMVTEVTPWWWAGVGLAGATLTLVGWPWSTESIRRRTAQLGPPPQAVLLLCLLACLPVLLAAVARGGLGGGWVLLGLSAVTAPAYAKALPGALFSARFLIPAATVAAVFAAPWPGWTAALVGGSAVTITAWSTQARLAMKPLVEAAPPATPEPTPLRIRSASQPSRTARPEAERRPNP